jgi:uncharacterized protein (TIGR02996 family)
MDMEPAFLQAIQDNPEDESTWSILADWLEEQGDSPRAELVRLQLLLRSGDSPERPTREDRLRALLASGVQPCVPALTNSVGMKLALIPPGRFLMGSDAGEKDRQDGESPRHEVEITSAFYLGVYQVTQEQYEKVMGINPSQFTSSGSRSDRVADLDTRSFPVDSVSWEQAVAFCQKLSTLGKEKGRVYRLPTEAEWEYACRAGTSAAYFFGDFFTSEQGNFDGNFPYGPVDKGPYLSRPVRVGSFAANAFGLYDMHGNIWEWCSDWYGAEYYAQSTSSDPKGPRRGTLRSQRGGSWYSYGWACRSACRSWCSPTDSADRHGLRVAMTLSAWPGKRTPRRRRA